MSKKIQWIIWGLALVAINTPTVLISSFSLFGTAEGTSIFSIDYLVAAIILLLGNIIIIQLLIAIRKGRYQEFVFGLSVAVAQAIGLYVTAITFSAAGLIITGLTILVAFGLLIKVIKQ